ncbi:MAG: hypothetical protein ACI9OJ_002002, partial [Myxococcota bacterium]
MALDVKIRAPTGARESPRSAHFPDRIGQIWFISCPWDRQTSTTHLGQSFARKPPVSLGFLAWADRAAALTSRALGPIVFAPEPHKAAPGQGEPVSKLARCGLSPRSSNRVRSASRAAVFLLVGVLSLGCDDDTIESKQPSQCTQAACPTGWCELRISFEDTCAGKLDVAEVLLDGALEPGAARYGQTFISTGHVPVGENSLFFVRGEDWQWRINFRCNSPATDGEYRLACTKNDDGIIEIGPDVLDDTSAGED